MKDAFSRCHPVVNFGYFSSVIIFSMLFQHPFLQISSLVIAVLYSVYLNGEKAVKFNLSAMLPMFLITAVINPLFSHAGATVLFFMNGNPVTLESAVYGISSGCMLITVIIWFSCYNTVMTSDKFIYIFGRIIPSLSLIFSMALRFAPRFRTQIKVISDAQKCIGKSSENDSISVKIKNSAAIVSILISWALENAIETADSMKSRGYGLHGRTAFSNFRLNKRDKATLTILIISLAVIVSGAAFGETAMEFFPKIIVGPNSLYSAITFSAYIIFLSIPMIINITEDIKWRYCKSKI